MTTPVVYRFVNHELQSSPGDGQIVGGGLNIGLRNSTTTSVPGLLESIDSSVKNAVKGIEAGHSAGMGMAAGTIGRAAGTIAKIDDVTAVGNNLLAGKHLEAGMEFAGAFSGAAGGSAGGYLAAAAAQAIALAPAWRVAAVGAGIFFGDQTAGDLGKALVYNEWMQTNAPSIAPNVALEPAATLNGTNYYVISSPDANGTPRTFVYTDSIAASGGDPLLMPNQSRYVPVVNQDISRQVVNKVLTELGYDPNISLGQWNVMQGLSPAGYAVGGVYYEHTGSATVAGIGSTAETRQPAVQVTTWRDGTTGAIMEARLSGRQVDGAFEAGPSGVFASGMDTAGRMVLKGEFAQRVADYQMRPSASTIADGATPQEATLAPVVVEGGRGLGNYTTVSIQTHADGAASFEFRGEDGSRAWVVQDAATGSRAVVINSGQDVAGQPSTVLYELDRHGMRIGQERYVDKVGMPVNEQGIVHGGQAPMQPEPIPHITTHEQRITPTLGGMSFAEAHKRRDEPEQIFPGSLQPVGKLAKPDRMHELTLLREIGIVNSRVKEELANAPNLHRALQPSLDRTQQQRAHDHAQDLAPRRTPNEAAMQPMTSPEMKAVAPQTMVPAPSHTTTPTTTTTTTPAAPDSQEMHARLAAKDAELAAAREQIARLTVQGFAVPRASEPATAHVEPAAPARQIDPRDPAHPDHKDFQKIFDVLAQDGRWNAQQSASIASQALANFKGDRLAKRADVVLLEPDTRGQLKLFVGHAPWGGLRCLSVAAVDPVQAARVPPEQGFERLEQATQMAQQRDIQDAQQWAQHYQQHQGNEQGPTR